MNNFKSCVPFVCTSSGCKQVCEKHDIGAKCGATDTNTATRTVENIDATNIQQNQQNSQKPIRQLEVVASSAEVCQMTQMVTKQQPLCPARCPDVEALHI